MTSKLGGGTVKIPGPVDGTADGLVPLATAPGDDDNMSVQLSGNNGATATSSCPILARTLIPPTGGACSR